MEYLATGQKRCIVTGDVLGTSAESYAQRKQRWEAQMAGLKEALTMFEGSDALLNPKLIKTGAAIIVYVF